ncbi:hypothetical protein LEMLEM_LOCUS25678 [Lemmus lemmus]
MLLPLKSLWGGGVRIKPLLHLHSGTHQQINRGGFPQKRSQYTML